MADPAVLDPLPYDPLPQTDPSHLNLSNPFDPLQFPDDIPSDLTLPPGLMSDLDFDGDLDFSISDLLDIPEFEEDFPADDGAGGGTHPSSSPDFDSKNGSGVSSSSPVSSSAFPVSGNRSLDQSGNFNLPSPDSGNSATCPPNSGDSASAAEEETVKLEDEDERNGWGLKRKKGREDRDGPTNPNPRSSKFHRSDPSDEANSSCMFNSGSEEEKRKARLMRNRESAQLSRQRKKHYVEELEDKVKSLHSMIAELNNKISFIMAENASLRQQLGGGGGTCPPPTVYPQLSPVAPMHYPWVPCSAYALRPQGSKVPLIPIPRLKPQQPAPAPKAKKSEGKKAESKTKKVASVSLLGLLFFMMFVGVFIPGVNLRYGGNTDLVSREHSFGKGKLFGQARGRVLTVSGNLNRSNQTEEIGLTSGKVGLGKGNIDWINGKVYGSKMTIPDVKQKECRSQHLPDSDVSGFPENASEQLLASLYVPRNDKLVKIDGNLIIHSVLASEKAMGGSASGAKGDKVTRSSGKETGLAIAGNLASALAVPKSGSDGERRSRLYRSIAEHQRALASVSEDTYKDNLKSTPADGPLKQWFREGLEGPILSSGMCTEVFQFDVSSTNSGGIIPATSIVNATGKRSSNSTRPGKMKNRRILYPQPIPLTGSTLNNTEEGFVKPTENSNFHGNKSASSMVVSVLLDPREAGDADGDGVITPKSISRIFVVVLLDSVKYVTYSCVLPFKSSAPHLVTT